MTTKETIEWFKKTFNKHLQAAVRGTPFSVDMLAAIALEVAARTKTPAQAKIELQSVKDNLEDVQLALTVEAKAAVQEAINAALEVLRSAVNSAAKVAIF